MCIMERQELFDKTVGILVDAYRNETLQAVNCAACAVGNMIASNCDIQIVSRKAASGYSTGTRRLFWNNGSGEIAEGWLRVLKAYHRGEDFEICKARYPESLKRLEATGYGFAELVRIEGVFEEASAQAGLDLHTQFQLTVADNADKYTLQYQRQQSDFYVKAQSQVQYKALVAVYDLLLEIHNADISQVSEAKEVFTKETLEVVENVGA